MSNELDLVARMVAWERGRAIRVASHRAVAVRDDALAVTTLALSGYDTLVLAVAVGARGEAPRIRACVEPRARARQDALLAWLSGEVTAYFQRCAARGEFPQVWVPSEATAEHLDLLSERYRTTRAPALRALGEHLGYATERLPEAGQQALVVAASALRAHWVTGQAADDERHLGVMLAWIAPPEGVPARDAARAAEDEPMGIKTTPAFDIDTLQPLHVRWREATDQRRAGDALAAAKAVQAALAAVVGRIHAATLRAMDLVAALPPLDALPELERREREAFAWWLGGREKGYAMPQRDNVRQAAIRLATREDAEETFDAARVHGDAVARAEAALAGRVLVGAVRDVRVARQGRATVCTFAVESEQPVLRLRARDTLAWLGDTRLQAVVTGVKREGARTRVELRQAAGMRCVGHPTEGAEASWGPMPPAWGARARVRKQVIDRLAVTPWTHDPSAAAPAPTSRPPPGDLLARVEGLR